MLWAHMAAKARVKASDDLTSKEMTCKMKRKRSFWKWLILWARAGVMAEARKKKNLARKSCHVESLQSRFYTKV